MPLAQRAHRSRVVRVSLTSGPMLASRTRSAIPGLLLATRSCGERHRRPRHQQQTDARATVAGPCRQAAIGPSAQLLSARPEPARVRRVRTLRGDPRCGSAHRGDGGHPRCSARAMTICPEGAPWAGTGRLGLVNVRVDGHDLLTGADHPVTCPSGERYGSSGGPDATPSSSPTGHRWSSPSVSAFRTEAPRRCRNSRVELPHTASGGAAPTGSPSSGSPSRIRA